MKWWQWKRQILFGQLFSKVFNLFLWLCYKLVGKTQQARQSSSVSSFISPSCAKKRSTHQRKEWNSHMSLTPEQLSNQPAGAEICQLLSTRAKRWNWPCLIWQQQRERGGTSHLTHLSLWLLQLRWIPASAAWTVLQQLAICWLSHLETKISCLRSRRNSLSFRRFSAEITGAELWGC